MTPGYLYPHHHNMRNLYVDSLKDLVDYGRSSPNWKNPKKARSAILRYLELRRGQKGGVLPRFMWNDHHQVMVYASSAASQPPPPAINAGHSLRIGAATTRSRRCCHPGPGEMVAFTNLERGLLTMYCG